MTAVDSLHALTLGDVLRENGRSRPQQLAVVDGDVRLTYRELDERVNQLAAALNAAGVRAGDRIVWLGQNSFRILELLSAAAKLGAMCCPVNWRQSVDELAFVLADLAPTVVVWQEAEIGDTVRAAREQAPGLVRVRWLQHDGAGGESYEAFLASREPADPAIAVDDGAPVLLMHTAAFTGRPSAAMLSHRALVVQAVIMSRAADIDSSYVYLNCGPLFHIATLMTTLATFLVAGTNVFTPRIDAEELCRLIETERCTGAFLMRPTIRRMLEINRDHHHDLSSLRTFAGKPEWNEMITIDTSPWARRPGGYGQTEVGGMLTYNALGADAIGADGRTAPLMQLRIVDPDDHDVPAGEVGEIVARGPTVMNAYWNRPEETARRFRHGWHHTNDLGRRETDGTITFIGPKTRLIKSALENIYPSEVEGCVGTLAGVRECAVIGVPDQQWTQSVKAIVALDDAATITADDVIEHCRTRIASYKKPKSVEFVEKLPRDGFLVDYDALDAQFGGGGYPGAGKGTD
jgi:acyl-CoA synthetase (AMP-forming)/AMP-acid ligase II